MPLDQFGDYVLLTNFHYYVERFAEKFNCDMCGEGRPMQAATNIAGLTIINFGIGSANAATIMDLLSARHPKGRAVPGQVRRAERLDRNRPLHSADRRHSRRRNQRRLFPAGSARPALVQAAQIRLREDRAPAIWITAPASSTRPIAGCGNTTREFLARLQQMTCIGIDMETATIFIVGHDNEIARGALLLGFRYAVHARRN